MDNLCEICRALRLGVCDNEGRLYLPLFGYDNEVVAYARAHEALSTLNEVFNRERYYEHIER